MPQPSRFLLLQARTPVDPMRPQEVRCFARALGCGLEQIEIRNGAGLTGSIRGGIVVVAACCGNQRQNQEQCQNQSETH